MARDLTGQRFGKLTVLGVDPDPYIAPSGGRIRRWKCLCDCGREATVMASSLISGLTKSCGCLRSSARILNPDLATAPYTPNPKTGRDLTGQHFGRLTALGLDPAPYCTPSGHKVRCWICQCDCGKTISVPTYRLTNGTKKSCGCWGAERKSKAPKTAPPKKEPTPKMDLTGQRFGRWTVLAEALPRKKLISNARYWRCQCDCGTIKEVSQTSLLRGESKSCGCYRREKLAEGRAKRDQNRQKRKEQSP